MPKKIEPIPPKLVEAVIPPTGQGGEKGKKMQTPHLLRGFKDVLPADEKYWRHVREASQRIADAYSFQYVETPILEEAALFARSIGQDTDIVEKEMYVFEDLDHEKVALRPEATASVARAYIVHGMWNMPQPVRLWYEGPFFRHERPQAGRQRAFHQIGFEILGEAAAVCDVLTVKVGWQLLADFGVQTVVKMNSIGCALCRPAFKAELTQYYRTKRHLLCENCKRRLLKNPLRLLDCKEPQCEPVKEGVPQLLDKICDECKKHFTQVLEYCDEAGVPYTLDNALVRGLDYYNRTVFEYTAAADAGGQQGALGAGGRYDYLVETIGGRPTPAVGCALGVERIIAEMHERGITPPVRQPPQVFVAQLGELARKRTLTLLEELRAAGFTVAENVAKRALRAQLEVAHRLHAPCTVILGQKEVLEGTVILRDMDSGIQEIIPRDKLVQTITRTLAARGKGADGAAQGVAAEAPPPIPPGVVSSLDTLGEGLEGGESGEELPPETASLPEEAPHEGETAVNTSQESLFEAIDEVGPREEDTKGTETDSPAV